MNQRAIFAGIQIDDEPIDYWVELVLRHTFASPIIIVTPNVDHFSRLDNDKDFACLYNAADYILCDSRIIQKVSYLTEKKYIRYVVPGSDLTRIIFDKLNRSVHRVLIIGSSDTDVEKIKNLYSLTHLTCIAPSMGFIKNVSEVDDIISQVIDENPEIIFLAVGSPQQEILAVRIKQIYQAKNMNGPVLLCVGASIDFIAGKTRRAPLVVQKAHLEWFYRAFSEPKRLIPRYFRNFLWLLRFLFKNRYV